MPKQIKKARPSNKRVKTKSDRKTRTIGSLIEISRLERKIRRSRRQLERYKRLVDHSPFLMARFDSNGRILFINQSFIHGLDATSINGSSEKLPGLWHDLIRQTVTTNTPITTDISLISRQGPKTYAFRFIPELGTGKEKDKVLSVMVSGWDVTEQRQYEQAFRSERELGQMYLDIADVILIALDDRGIVKNINRKGCQILEWPEEEIVGKRWFDHFLPEDQRNGVGRTFSDLMDGSTNVLRVTNPVLTRSGKIRIISWHNTVFRDEAGRIVGTFSSGQDITEHKAAEAALLESEERFRNLFEQAPFGAALVDRSGRLTISNQALQEMLGFTASQLRGMRFFDLTHPEDADRDEHRFQKLLFERSSYYNHEKRFLGSDGRVVWGNLGISILQYGADPPDTTIIMIQDITEQKQAGEEKVLLEAHYRQHQKLESIGTLASGVAHEINNPVNGIMNYAQLIADRLDPADPLHQFTEEIISESQRIASIVRDLLTFARKERASRSAYPVADIIYSTLSLVRSALAKDQITIDVEIPDVLPVLHCHGQQIQLVLMNLMTNARDALNERYPGFHKQKRIIIRADATKENDKGWVHLVVENYGKGIEPDVLPRIFDPFFTTKDRAHGTGLGLWISYGIVEEHSGRLTVVSDETSTRFCMDLPL